MGVSPGHSDVHVFAERWLSGLERKRREADEEKSAWNIDC
jgi:hypothetical protein